MLSFSFSFLSITLHHVWEIGVWRRAKSIACCVRILHMSQKQASKQLGVARETLRRHLNGSNKFSREGAKYFGRPAVLTQQMEADLP